MISLALYLPLVISLDINAFNCKNIKCRIGGSYLQDKSLLLLFFRNFVKLSRWERKMKLWKNCIAIEKMTKNKCVSYWTRDISSWSLEEKLHWYNITHVVNSSLSIQLWQGVTCPAQRRKGFCGCECFALKEKELNLNHRIN